MTQLLVTIFGELGITQYLDAFLEQGFDTWETILDITESDLYVGDLSCQRRLGLGILMRSALVAMRWE